MKQLLFIYNPNAGRQKVRGSLADILDAFAEEGCRTTACPTQSAGDASRLAAELADQYDLVVCCGGDGTLNETVTGLMTLPAISRPPLGYIPAGSTNDFARNLSLPRSMREMAKVAVNGVPRPCDLGVCNGRYFVYVAAFGLFTDVSYATPQASKNALGHLAYVLEAAGRLASVKSYHVKVETPRRTEEGEFIYGMVGNTVSVGGVLTFPSGQVYLDDGRFEVLLVRTPKTAVDLQNTIMSLMTQNLDPGNGSVVAFPASDVTFTCQETVPWTLDGEFGGDHQKLHIRNLPREITLLCGE